MIQQAFLDAAKDSIITRADFDEFVKMPHGKTPSGFGYYKEDTKTTLGRMQTVINFFDANPKKSFNPWDTIPNCDNGNDFELSCMSLVNMGILKSSGLNFKLQKRFIV